MSGKSMRGFAVMDPELRRRIASMGGKAAHQNGTAHTWNSAEARKAALKSRIGRDTPKQDAEPATDVEAGA